MMTQPSPKHVVDNASDYVLNLLSDDERRAFARHIASCEQCQHAVMFERQLARDVRETVRIVASSGRRDPLPWTQQQAGLVSTLRGSWPRHVALVGILLMILIGTFGHSGRSERGQDDWYLSTSTRVPTVAVASQQPVMLAETASAVVSSRPAKAGAIQLESSASPPPTITPAPVPLRSG